MIPTKKIVITGGGTGGHVFPALSLCQALRNRGYEILYVGSSRGLEARLVPSSGFTFFSVQSGAVKGKSLFRIMTSLYRVSLSASWSLRFLRSHRPTAVIGVGGYVSVPVCVAAYLLRLPLYLQEQNVSVGIANRFLGRLSRRVFLGFEQAASYFPRRRCLITGNPIRAEFFKKEFPSYQPTAHCLLILGGSQGARAINELLTSQLEALHELDPELSILHQTGESDFDWVRERYQKKFKGTFAIFPFITDVASAYAKATLVISRSGALTVSELIQVGRPAILIPYPRKGQNDQTANAYWLEQIGAARVVEQGENFSDRFTVAFKEIYRPEKLAQMAANYEPIKREDATLTIVQEIEKELAGTDS